jgi:hypothetical protein
VNGVEAEGQLDKENTVTMPGVLKRPFDQVENADGLTGDRTDQKSTMSSGTKRTFDRIDGQSNLLDENGDQRPSKRQAMTGANGEIGTTPNGIMNGGEHYQPSAGLQKDLDQTISQLTDANPPPKIFHIEDGLIPLSVVWERLAQEAHNDMEDLIKGLAEMTPSQANGYSTPKNDINVEKKNRIWEFAHNWRAKFIKLGVLSAWSTNADAVSKIIDINYWITIQRANHREAVNWMGELKRILIREKLPPPDLKTALEILATGKAKWVSDVSIPFVLLSR